MEGVKTNQKGFPTMDGLSRELDRTYKGSAALLGMMNEKMFSLTKADIRGQNNSSIYEATMNVTQSVPLMAMPQTYSMLKNTCKSNGILIIEISDSRDFSNPDNSIYWLDDIYLDLPEYSGEEVRVQYHINDVKVSTLRAIPVSRTHKNKESSGGLALIGIGLKNLHMITNICNITITVLTPSLKSNTVYECSVIKQWFHQMHARSQFAAAFTKSSEEFNKWKQPGLHGEGIDYMITDHYTSIGIPDEYPEVVKAVIIRTDKPIKYFRFLGDTSPAWIHVAEVPSLSSDTLKTYMWKFSEQPTLHQFSRDPFRMLDDKTYSPDRNSLEVASKIDTSSMSKKERLQLKNVPIALIEGENGLVESVDMEYIFVRSRIFRIKDSNCKLAL